MSNSYNQRLSKAKKAIQESETILIGAGAGLSTAAGIEYGGKRFRDNFQDFIDRYHLIDMYSSAFYPFKTREERWAYMSRHIKLNRYDAEVGKVYKDLKKIAKNKNHFILTTNADAQFYRAGFDNAKIFATQGDYAKFQCSKPCHDTLYDNEEIVTRMVTEQHNFRIPTELIPLCPVCGGNMTPHLRIDDTFIENEDWRTAGRRYTEFLQSTLSRKLVLFEIGVGYNTPGIIKYPFEQMTAANPDATLIRINRDDPEVSPTNKDKTIAFSEDTRRILEFFSL